MPNRDNIIQTTFAGWSYSTRERLLINLSGGMQTRLEFHSCRQNMIEKTILVEICKGSVEVLHQHI